MLSKIIQIHHAALPGGHLEYGEDLKECLSREMIEELGVKPEIGRLLYINIFFDKEKSRQYIEPFFEVKNGRDYVDAQKLARSHAQELDAIIWVTPDENITVMPKTFGEDLKAGKLLSDEVRYITMRKNLLF